MNLLKDINLFYIYFRQAKVFWTYRNPLLTITIYTIPLIITYLTLRTTAFEIYLKVIQSDNLDPLNNIITFIGLLIAVLTILFGNIYGQFDNVDDKVKMQYLESIKISLLSNILSSVIIALLIIFSMFNPNIGGMYMFGLLIYLGCFLLINFSVILSDVVFLTKKDFK